MLFDCYFPVFCGEKKTPAKESFENPFAGNNFGTRRARVCGYKDIS